MFAKFIELTLVAIITLILCVGMGVIVGKTLEHFNLPTGFKNCEPVYAYRKDK